MCAGGRIQVDAPAAVAVEGNRARASVVTEGTAGGKVHVVGNDVAHQAEPSLPTGCECVGSHLAQCEPAQGGEAGIRGTKVDASAQRIGHMGQGDAAVGLQVAGTHNGQGAGLVDVAVAVQGQVACDPACAQVQSVAGHLDVLSCQCQCAAKGVADRFKAGVAAAGVHRGAVVGGDAACGLGDVGVGRAQFQHVAGGDVTGQDHAIAPVQNDLAARQRMLGGQLATIGKQGQGAVAGIDCTVQGKVAAAVNPDASVVAVA